MQPKNTTQSKQEDLFKTRLDQILNPKHPLFILAHMLDWSFFEQEFGPLFVANQGRPGLPVRLVVGLHYLKHTFNESDESVVERFLENPYWQYFRLRVRHSSIDMRLRILPARIPSRPQFAGQVA